MDICNHFVGTRDHHARSIAISARNEAAKFVIAHQNQSTHVENVEDSDKVLLPGCNFVFVTLRENELEHCIPFTLGNGLHLNFGYGSVIRGWVS